jgi:hypothetical protein
MEGVIEVNLERIETLYASGVELPYVQFGQAESALKLVYDSEDYWYVRTLPLKGYGAVMARHISGLRTDGKKPILARFWDRIYIYATGVTPIGTGKK